MSTRPGCPHYPVAEDDVVWHKFEGRVFVRGRIHKVNTDTDVCEVRIPTVAPLFLDVSDLVHVAGTTWQALSAGRAAEAVCAGERIGQPVPRVGDIVHFRADGDSPCEAAIITVIGGHTQIFNPQIIAATVFHVHGLSHADVVVYHETGDSQPVATWHWPECSCRCDE
jgi:hypothetical protein